MRVEAVLARPAAREVLGGQRDPVALQALLALEAPHHGGDRRSVEVRILTEGAAAAEPARIGDCIGHVHVALAQPRGDPLGSRLRREVGDQIEITCGGQTQRPGPLGEVPVIRRGAHFEAAELVLGIGGHHHRDAQPGALGDLVHRVHPGRDERSRRRLSHDEVPHVQLGDLLRRPLIRQARGVVRVVLDAVVLLVEGPVVTGELWVRLRDAHRPGVDDHQADLLLRCHPGDQVRSALRRTQPPVLVRVEDTVAVQVPEPQSLQLEDRLYPGADDYLFRTLHFSHLGTVSSVAQQTSAGFRQENRPPPAQTGCFLR